MFRDVYSAVAVLLYVATLTATLEVRVNRTELVQITVDFPGRITRSGQLGYQWPQRPGNNYNPYNYNNYNKNNRQPSYGSPSYRQPSYGSPSSRQPSYGPPSYNGQSKWWCPANNLIYPCTCDGPQSFILLTCDRLANSYSLNEVFRAHYPSVDVGKISITNSRIDKLMRGDLGSLRFEYIFMKKNTLKLIDIGALSPSKASLKRLEIVHCDLEKFPFKNMSSFPKLEYLDLHYNGIKSIPDYAFGANSKIKEIDLSYNKIAYLGSFAIERLYSLEKLDLKYNKLTVLNNDALALVRPNPKLNIDLSNNQMAMISQGAFTNQFPHLLNLSYNSLKTYPESQFKPVMNGMSLADNGLIDVRENRFRCSCTNIGWMIRCPNSLKRRVAGFYCKELGKSLQSLTLYDVNCPY